MTSASVSIPHTSTSVPFDRDISDTSAVTRLFEDDDFGSSVSSVNSACSDALEAAAVAWSDRKQEAERSRNWVTSLLGDTIVRFDIGGEATQWLLESRLNAEKIQCTKDHEIWPCNASAVFRCTRIHENKFCETAVCKIYLQIPDHDEQYVDLEPHPESPRHVLQEIDALKLISRWEGKSFGPRLLSTRTSAQDGEMWVEGGYCCMILMESLPGTRLTEKYFWSLPLEERDLIRAAFKRSWLSMIDVGIYHGDRALRNLLWDETSQDVYIVDYEDAVLLSPQKKADFGWFDNVWSKWNLKQHMWWDESLGY